MMPFPGIPLSCCQKCGGHVTLARFVADYVCRRCQHCQGECEAEDATLLASLDLECVGAPFLAQQRPFWQVMADDEYVLGRRIVRCQEFLQ